MPLEQTGCFICRPFLNLSVAGATKSGGIYYADYNADGGFITVTASTTYKNVAFDIDAPVVDGFGGPVGNDVAGHDDQYQIPLDNNQNVRPHGDIIIVTATASSDGDEVGLLPIVQRIQIVVRPIVDNLAFVADHFAFQQGAVWYATDLRTLVDNAADYTANILATLAPNTNQAATYAPHVQWFANFGTLRRTYTLQNLGGDLQRGIRLNHTRVVRTWARVRGGNHGAWSDELPLDIRAPATSATLANNLRVQLHKFTFGGAGHFAVTQEDAGHFNQPYSAHWTRGFVPTPQAYVADENCTLSNVELSVLNNPGANTDVNVRATAYFIHHDNTITPAHAQSNHTFNNGVGGNQNVGNLDLGDVPDEVMCLEPMLIFWEVQNNPGGDWLPLAVTANCTYVTAATKVASTKAELNNGLAVYTYDSLLAISCKAIVEFADGRKNANNVRDAIAQAFQLGVGGVNNRVKRLNRNAGGQPTMLKYWYRHEDGTGTEDAMAPAQSLNQGVGLNIGGGKGNMFTNPIGNLACGVWASMLLAMWALHGKNDGHYIAVNAALPVGVPDPALAFMVKNWSYNNRATLRWGAFTHNFIQPSIPTAIPPVPDGPVNMVTGVDDSVPGQNNTNAPCMFCNHFIVREGFAGPFFDPSYGSTESATRNNWVERSLDGLVDFGMAPPPPPPPPPAPPPPPPPRGGYAQLNAAGQVQANPDVVTLHDQANGGNVPIP